MAKSQPNRVSRVELRKLVTRPWCCGALQEQGAGVKERRQDFAKVTEALSPWGGKKGGVDKVALLHYCSGKSLQHRPSLTLWSLHVNRAERVSQHSHLLHHKQEWRQDPQPSRSLYSICTIWWRKGRSRWDFLKTVTSLAHLKVTENRTIWYASFEAIWTYIHPPKTVVNCTFQNVK